MYKPSWWHILPLKIEFSVLFIFRNIMLLDDKIL